MKKIILTLLLTLSTLVNVNAVAAFSLDVDNNGSFSSSNDGLVIFKYLLNPNSNNLHTTIANDAAEDRKTTAQLKAYLDNAGDILDVDGNQTLSSSNDGLVIFKYLLNPNSNNLHTTIANDAVSSKTTTIDLKAYLDRYISSVVITTATATVTGTFSESNLAVGVEYTNNDNDDLDSGTYVETFITELEDGVEVDTSKRVSTGISYTISSDVNTGTATATGTFSESDVGNEYQNNDNDDLDNGTYVETFTTEFINGVEDTSKRVSTGISYTVSSDVNTGTATATGTFSESDLDAGDEYTNNDNDDLDSGTYVKTFTTEFINGVEDTSKRTLTGTTYTVSSDVNTGTATATGTFSESVVGDKNNDNDILDDGTYVDTFTTEFINGVEDISKRILIETIYNFINDFSPATVAAELAAIFADGNNPPGEVSEANYPSLYAKAFTFSSNADRGDFIASALTEGNTTVTHSTNNYPYYFRVTNGSKSIEIDYLQAASNSDLAEDDSHYLTIFKRVILAKWNYIYPDYDPNAFANELAAIYAADTAPTAFASGSAIDDAAQAVNNESIARNTFIDTINSSSYNTGNGYDEGGQAKIEIKKNDVSLDPQVFVTSDEVGSFAGISKQGFSDFTFKIILAIWHLENPVVVPAYQQELEEIFNDTANPPFPDYDANNNNDFGQDTTTSTFGAPPNLIAKILSITAGQDRIDWILALGNNANITGNDKVTAERDCEVCTTYTRDFDTDTDTGYDTFQVYFSRFEYYTGHSGTNVITDLGAYGWLRYAIDAIYARWYVTSETNIYNGRYDRLDRVAFNRHDPGNWGVKELTYTNGSTYYYPVYYFGGLPGNVSNFSSVRTWQYQDDALHPGQLTDANWKAMYDVWVERIAAAE